MHPVNLGDLFQTLIDSRKNLPESGVISLSIEKRIFLNAGYSDELETGLKSVFTELLEYRCQREKVYVSIKPDQAEILIRISFAYAQSSDSSSQKGDARKFFSAVRDLDEVGVKAVLENTDEGQTVLKIWAPVMKIGDFSAFRKSLSIMFGISENIFSRKENGIRTLVALNDLPEGFYEDDAVGANIYYLFAQEEEKNRVDEQRQKLEELKLANGNGRKVLIADDSLFVHFFLGSLLCEMGLHVVDFASNGREAVNLFEKTKPAIVTMDCTMPVLSGIEAADEIWKKDKTAKIIFITGLGDHPLIKEKIAQIGPSGCYCILAKPIDESELRQAIATFLP